MGIRRSAARQPQSTEHRAAPGEQEELQQVVTAMAMGNGVLMAAVLMTLDGGNKNDSDSGDVSSGEQNVVMMVTVSDADDGDGGGGGGDDSGHERDGVSDGDEDGDGASNDCW